MNFAFRIYERIYVFCVILTLNSDYSLKQHGQVGIYNRDADCVFRMK
jgi:hypothetical protein